MSSAMLAVTQFNRVSYVGEIDTTKGVIHGVSVISIGDAKGHGMEVDKVTLEQFCQVAKSHKDGIKTKFGLDHDAGVESVNGVLKNFRIDGDKVRADLHLLKSDPNRDKVLELAQVAPNEFGLSASFSGNHITEGLVKKVRCSEIYSVDFVSDPAANKSLFSTNHNQMKDIALALGLPETATEAEIIAAGKVAFEYKAKMDAEAKKKLEAEANDKKRKELEAEGKDEKFESVLKTVTELSSKLAEIEKTNLAVKEAAQKEAKLAEIKTLVADASREGKVVPLSDVELAALPLETVKLMLSKLPAGQVKLSGKTQPEAKDKDGKALTGDALKTHLGAVKAANAVALNELFNK